MGFPWPRLGGRVMTGLGAALATLALSAALLVCSTPTALAAIPAWTTYHHDGARSGIDPDSTTPLPPARLWETGALDGSMWGEPLVYGSTVYVATENDTVYALDAGTGAIRWEAHVGTPVPSSELECGDISPTVGITSTPVIDAATKTLYAVADTWDGIHASSIRHYPAALDLGTGAMRPRFPLEVDPPFPIGGDAAHQLQRAGLALAGGQVVIGYGGNDGDCGTYWGWLVAAPESGSGPEYHFQVEAEGGHHGGAIWGAGNAPAVDGVSDLYAATGNGYSGGHFDDSESVLRLEPDMHLVEFWAPTNWLELDEGDGDLSSSNPVVLPNGLIFQIGKSGEAVLLRPGAFGGIGGAPAASIQVCGSWGGGIYVPASAASGTLYITCLGSGLHAIALNELNAPEPQLSELAGWSVPGNAIGPPIYAGGLIWSTHWNETVAEEGGVLYGIDPRTGEVKVQEELGAFEHFATPSAGGGRLFVANNDHLTALDIAVPPTPTPTSTALGPTGNFEKGKPVMLTAAVSPVPDGGTVAFTEVGTPIAGCGEVHVSLANGGKASCQTSFGQVGYYTLAASYSGDAYYAPSTSPYGAVQITGGPGPALGLLSALKESHKRWREGKAAPHISSVAASALTSANRHAKRRRNRAPVGTTFTFVLTEPSPMAFSFEQSLPGRRLHGRCAAIPKHGPLAHAHGRSCRRIVTAATLNFTGHRGLNTVRFEGRVSRRKLLRPGPYTLVVVAGGALMGSVAQRVGFTIVKG
jgi:outer membrane protein assembly factor BamB